MYWGILFFDNRLSSRRDAARFSVSETVGVKSRGAHSKPGIITWHYGRGPPLPAYDTT